MGTPTCPKSMMRFKLDCNSPPSAQEHWPSDVKLETDPIVVHVIDQTTGKPAGGIDAIMYLRRATGVGSDSSDESTSAEPKPAIAKSPLEMWYGRTDAATGRITYWYDCSSVRSQQLAIPGSHHRRGKARQSPNTYISRLRFCLQDYEEAFELEWDLQLETQDYWANRGCPSFYRAVTISFNTDPNDARRH